MTRDPKTGLLPATAAIREAEIKVQLEQLIAVRDECLKAGKAFPFGLVETIELLEKRLGGVL